MSRPVVILDMGAQRGLTHVFEDMAGLIVARTPGEVEPALQALDAARSRGFYAAGHFSYELGYALELKLVELMPAERDLPLIWFGLFRSRKELGSSDLEALIAASTRGRAYAGPLTFADTCELYGRKFARIEEYIRAGDVYQVNLTFPARFHFVGNPLALYGRLRESAQAGHGAYIDDGERALLSFTPELFFRIEDGTASRVR
jgi:para-aminobenzoate synthetase/4-amino-4-deoxychorismate lyase